MSDLENATLEDFDGEKVGQLEIKDQPRDETAESLLKELARREKIANNQRESLFRVVLGLAIASLAVVSVILLLLGIGCLHLETPVMVAFISALAVQSFVLLGFLARGLFMAVTPASKIKQEVE